MRAQAALFDGILFLLLVTFSVSMMYAYLTSYGVAQERTLRSSHEINFMQELVKTIYSVDVSTLKGVPKWEADSKEKLNPAYADLNCSKLTPYEGRISVAELLKKDLSDFSGSACGEDTNCQSKSLLDDKFGESDAPGATALRCALKEFMKPFTFSGMEYLAEVENEFAHRVTARNSTGQEIVMGNTKIASCEEAANLYNDLLAVRAPFRIRVDINSGLPLYQNTPKTFTYTLRVCTWRKAR